MKNLNKVIVDFESTKWLHRLNLEDLEYGITFHTHYDLPTFSVFTQDNIHKSIKVFIEGGDSYIKEVSGVGGLESLEMKRCLDEWLSDTWTEMEP